MVFENLKTKFLEKRLKLAKGMSNVSTTIAKRKLAKVLKLKIAREKLMQVQLKNEAERDELLLKIKNANKLKLTPTQKVALKKRLEARRKRIKIIKKSLSVSIGAVKGGLKAVGDHLRAVEERNLKAQRKAKRKTKKSKK